MKRLLLALLVLANSLHPNRLHAAVPAAHGLADLEKALKHRGLEPLRQRSLTDKGPPEVVIGIAGSTFRLLENICIGLGSPFR